MSVTKPSPESVLISESCLQNRIRELGTQIFTDYENKELVLLGVLRGSVLFFADLARAIFKAQDESQTREVALRFEFVQLMSYHDSTRPSTVKLIRGGSDYLKERHVLIVEDIVDTGRTLTFLREHLQALNPKTVKVCTLLDKPSQRQVPVPVDYIGFEIPDTFVVGYGLDYAQQYRNLPYIAILESI
ncbi:hypoxanthine phosphoribosyltransferase [Candidatus Poribacteria bacterium]|nr:hypoxanthine phosphoribosyltransferase [Candidatus Poribacteria bacterium]